MKQLKGEIVQVLPDVLTPGAMYFVPTDNGRFTINISDDNGVVRPLNELDLVDASGDVSFTKQVVAKEDGTLGMVDKSVNRISRVDVVASSLSDVISVSEEEVPDAFKVSNAEGYNKTNFDLLLEYKLVLNKSVFNADNFKIKSLKFFKYDSELIIAENDIDKQSYTHYSVPNETDNVWVFLIVRLRNEIFNTGSSNFRIDEHLLNTEFSFGDVSLYDISQLPYIHVGVMYNPILAPITN